MISFLTQVSRASSLHFTMMERDHWSMAEEFRKVNMV